jgi:hypothetical protein
MFTAIAPLALMAMLMRMQMRIDSRTGAVHCQG